VKSSSRHTFVVEEGANEIAVIKKIMKLFGDVRILLNITYRSKLLNLSSVNCFPNLISSVILLREGNDEVVFSYR